MNRFISPLAAAVPGLLGLPTGALFRAGSSSALSMTERADRSDSEVQELPLNGWVVKVELPTPSV